MSRDLTCRRVMRESLGDGEIERMFELMQANYDRVDKKSFVSDLSWKDEVLVLLDTAETIQGFSTLALNPLGCGADEYDILYSGDTIINPSHWGNQELVRGFCLAAGNIRAERGKRLYWYLLSKGYRTYLYLPLFTHDYYPCDRGSEDTPRLRSIADQCSRRLFGEAWNSDLGVLKFATSRGQLNSQLADDTHRRVGNRHVDFFLRSNPGFVAGDELVCVAELSPANTRRIAGRFFRQGMKVVNRPGAAAQF
jgi:hypothetical protein